MELHSILAMSYLTIKYNYQNMKLTETARQKINVPRIRMLLALELNVSDQTMVRYIKDNNDELTKAAALKVIRKETGLKDKEILIEEIESIRA